MKRTKELYFRPHPDYREREGISGVTYLDGEDRGRMDYVLIGLLISIQWQNSTRELNSIKNGKSSGQINK